MSLRDDFHRTLSSFKTYRVTHAADTRVIYNIIFYIVTTQLQWYTPRMQHVPALLITYYMYVYAIDAIKLQRKNLIQHTREYWYYIYTHIISYDYAVSMILKRIRFHFFLSYPFFCTPIFRAVWIIRIIRSYIVKTLKIFPKSRSKKSPQHYQWFDTHRNLRSLYYWNDFNFKILNVTII